MNTLNNITLPITGLNCAGCAGRAQKAIEGVAGVGSANVNFATETAAIAVGDAKLRDIEAALKAAGYPARSQETPLFIDGMSCASCVARVEKALRALPGVLSAEVNFATETANIRHFDSIIGASALRAAVEEAGYGARIENKDEQVDHKAEEQKILRRDFWLALILTLPIFASEMLGHIIPSFHHWLYGTFSQNLIWSMQALLCAVVMIFPGRRFYAIGLPALFRGAPDMNALVAVGTLAAFGYSLFVLFFPNLLPIDARHVYFESAAVIVTLILFGRMLEARAKGQAGAAIASLLKLQPASAQVKRGTTTREMPIGEIIAGDIVIVRAGERIPVDGNVTAGESYVEESALTGEAMPVAKSVGAEVFAGTINQEGSLEVQTTAIGSATTLSQIIRMVENAQGAKLPIQSLIDKVTLVFVPVVMGIALLTFLLWLVFGGGISAAVVASVSVLIIACPCAMGLATPTSILVGTGRAASLGIFFRGGDALQSLSGVKTIAFDKTGTLTKGQAVLTDIVPNSGFSESEILQLAASAEAGSEHPLAHAIASRNKSDLLPATGFQSLTGRGVVAEVNGKRILIGNQKLMAEYEIIGDYQASEALAEAGKTPVFMAIDDRFAAILAIADEIKAEAPGLIKALKARGITPAMFTGDNARTAKAIAHQLGIDLVEAEVLPKGKVEAIDRLKKGEKIAFVGDGINDAPALAHADIGIAIGTGSDVAIEAGDVVLTGGALDLVEKSIKISQATLRNIKQNLAWAFGYNIILVPVAAGVLYPAFGILLSPMLAAFAMAFSSVFVLGNALRLRRAG